MESIAFSFVQNHWVRDLLCSKPRATDLIIVCRILLKTKYETKSTTVGSHLFIIHSSLTRLMATYWQMLREKEKLTPNELFRPFHL